MLQAITNTPPGPTGLTGLWSDYRHCRTTRDYIDLSLDCADQALRVPRAVLGLVRLAGWVPQLGRRAPERSLQEARLTMMDQVNHLEATLADCERQVLNFEAIEGRLTNEAKAAHARGDTAQLKRIWEEVRTCRERQQMEEQRRQKVRGWQQELWREAHALQDVEEERRALQTLEQVNGTAEARRARAARLEAAMTRAQMARDERIAEAAPEGAPQDFAEFCAGLQAAFEAPASVPVAYAPAAPELA